MEKKYLFIDKIIKTTLGKVDEGYIYIFKDKFLGKKDEELMPKGRTDLPIIKEYDIAELDMFDSINKIKDQDSGIDGWVWRYFFNNEISSVEVSIEDFGFTEEFSKKINYNSTKYETSGVEVDKTIEDTITLKYNKETAYIAYKIIYNYMFNCTDDYIGMDATTDMYDSIDLYKHIRSKNEITVYLTKEDYSYIKCIIINISTLK